MLQHIVLIKPREGVDEAEVEAARQGLVGLVGQIPGLRSVVWGTNVSVEGKSQGYTLGFVVEFDSRSDVDVYMPHPAHKAVQPLVGAIAELVLVFDLEG